MVCFTRNGACCSLAWKVMSALYLLHNDLVLVLGINGSIKARRLIRALEGVGTIVSCLRRGAKAML